MTNSKDKIKYVVTEGGEVLGVDDRPPRVGEKFICGEGIATAPEPFAAQRLVLTPISPPPFVDREVVEQLVEVTKRAHLLTGNVSPSDESAQATYGRVTEHVYRLNEGIDEALAAAEQALHTKPKERYYTQETAVRDRERGEFVCGCDTTEIAEQIAAALNAQEGDAS